MISDIIRDKLTQNPPIIPLNPPVSGANAANNFWKVPGNVKKAENLFYGR